MKKNQPLNIQRRQLLAQLPHYIAVGATAYIGLNGGVGARIAGASEQSLALVPANGGLPDLTLMSDTGETRLSALAEQNLVINFWATWCAPCVAELPTLEAAAGILAADNIKLVLISMDRGGPEVARPFLQERSVLTPLSLYDPQAEAARAVGLRGLPTTLLVKKNQAEYAVHTGPAEWDDAAVIEQLRAYLSE
jgi:thiol-disulfide isomerase/thioredoxin